MREIVIEAKDISRIFYINNCDTIFDYFKVRKNSMRKEIVALKNVSFNIRKGEFIGLLGLNGAGKSSLIKIMTGILVPTSGMIKVLGNDPFKKRLINNFKIGAVFGQRCQLRWDISPMESYRLFQAIYKISEETFEYRLAVLIQSLELGDIIKQPVRTLSLGQRMRAELAGVFLYEPEILFLDEPTIGLDVFSKEAIIRFLDERKREGNTTIIFTTHDMEDIKRLCNRLIILENGELKIDDKIENLEKYTNLNSSIIFKFEGKEFLIPKSIESIELSVEDDTVVCKGISESDIPRIITSVVSCNKIKGIEMQKPEFKDFFMNLYERNKNEK